MQPALLAFLAVGALLAGCAVPQQAGQKTEVRTASDQTDADRRARVRMELAAGYFGRGQLNTALDEVKLALVAQPELPEAFNLRGLIYAAMNEPRLAEESFQRALQLAPRDAALIGDDDDAVVETFERSDGGGSALDQPNLRRIAQITIVVDDRVIAIEKDSAVHVNSVALSRRLLTRETASFTVCDKSRLTMNSS